MTAPDHLDASETDVLIVGAGPTGLTLAVELAARGVAHRLVEQRTDRPTTSRALVVQTRTLELLRAMGVADRLIAQGRFARGMSVRRGARHIVDADIGTVDFGDSPYGGILFVSQVETERALEDRLGALGGRVERGVRLDRFSVDGGRVDARLRHGGDRVERVRARYIIGCDGAHSVVRKTLGLSFEGGTYPQSFILADVAVEAQGDAPPDDLARLWLTDSGVMAVLPLPEPGHCRLIVTEGPEHDTGDEPTLDDFQRRCDAASTGLRLRDPVWLSRFRLHHRGVDRYRVGPGFVAGDAAHIHSPAGGQGMNTGIQDACNLGWKLAAVIRDGADDALLDTYHDERWPVGDRLLRFTDRLFAMMSTPKSWMRWLRDRLAPVVLPRVLADTDRRTRALRFISQLAIRYRGAWGGEATGAGAIHGPPGPGWRAPDGALLDPSGAARRLFDVIGGRWTLLVFRGPTAERAADPAAATLARWAAHNGIGRVTIAAAARGSAWVDVDGAVHARYGLDGPGVYLVRPDGHVAWRGAGVDAAALIAWGERSPLPFTAG